MKFQQNFPFQKPPKTFRGMLILETDDGHIGDYTHWYPLLKSKTQKSQWFPFQYKVAASAVINSSLLGNEGHVTKEQLDELVSEGWEVINHGRTGAGLNLFTLQQPANVGDTTIHIRESTAHGMRFHYEYVINRNGEYNEVIKPIARNGGEVTLSEPLKNSYSVNANVELTFEDLEREVNGGLDDLLNMGYDVKHYVNSMHYWYYTTLQKIRERHLTARTADGNLATNTLPIPDLHRLSGNLDGAMRPADIVPFIDKIYEEDSIAIWYGHGFNYTRGSNLDKLVDYANEKGVKIVSRHEAYTERMKK